MAQDSIRNPYLLLPSTPSFLPHSIPPLLPPSFLPSLPLNQRSIPAFKACKQLESMQAGRTHWGGNADSNSHGLSPIISAKPQDPHPTPLAQLPNLLLQVSSTLLLHNTRTTALQVYPVPFISPFPKFSRGPALVRWFRKFKDTPGLMSEPLPSSLSLLRPHSGFHVLSSLPGTVQPSSSFLGSSLGALRSPCPPYPS